MCRRTLDDVASADAHAWGRPFPTPPACRYDLVGLPERSMEAFEGIDESAQVLRALLRAEAEAAPGARLALAGFRCESWCWERGLCSCARVLGSGRL